MSHLGGSKDVLRDIGVRPRGVRIPITWKSVAHGDAASVEPATPEYTKGALCDPSKGLYGEC
jgi:hypothetical protein